MRCFFCDDPSAHPATGCAYTERVLACHACVTRFWSWFRGMLAGPVKPRTRRGGPKGDFYAAAARNNPALLAQVTGASSNWKDSGL